MVFRGFALSLMSVSATLLLHGCAVTNFDESSVGVVPDQPVTESVVVPFRLVGEPQPDWIVSEAADAPEITASRSVESIESDIGLGSAFSFWGSIFTATLLPMYFEQPYADTYTLVWKEQLFESRVDYNIDSYFSVYFPLPMLFLGTLGEDPAPEQAKASEYTTRIHEFNLKSKLSRDVATYKRLNPETSEELASFLRGEGRDSVYAPSSILKLAALAPDQEPRSYHARYADIPAYRMSLPEDQQAWLIGPPGLRGIDLENKLRSGVTEDELLVEIANAFSDGAGSPIYSEMRQVHRKMLVEAGLPPNIVDLMSVDEPPAEILAAASTGKLRDESGKLNIPTEEDLLEQLVRKDNNGKYMSPYTSDGVLAEWVDSAINANIGSTVGSGVGAAAGAYAADKALESVPFGGLLGGMIGSEVGESVGRETAISASGGWEAIRGTSDRSFDSIQNMVEYLRRKYGSTPNYADAMAATAQIYPDLQAYL